MYYGEIKTCDIANGPGVRVTLFVSGCRNHCPNCFQPQTWDFTYGRPFDEEAKALIFGELEKGYVKGLTILGGEPMEPENQRSLLPLVKEVKERFPEKTIWCFSGNRLEDEILKEGERPHTEITEEFLSYLDVLVDGRFIEAEKQLGLRFRGSRNQRLIDLNKTRETGQVVLWDDGTGRG